MFMLRMAYETKFRVEKYKKKLILLQETKFKSKTISKTRRNKIIDWNCSKSKLSAKIK